MVVTQRNMERSMLRIRPRNRNNWIRNKSRVEDVVKRIAILKWQGATHLMRREDSILSGKVTTWRLISEIRNRRRPRTRWWDDIGREQEPNEWAKQKNAQCGSRLGRLLTSNGTTIWIMKMFWLHLICCFLIKRSSIVLRWEVFLYILYYPEMRFVWMFAILVNSRNFWRRKLFSTENTPTVIFCTASCYKRTPPG